MSLPVNYDSPLMAKLNYNPINTEQKGPVCKLAALRTCMQLLRPGKYYPLYKNKAPNVELSVRRIAKECGSSQGEVTSPDRLRTIARKLGLEAKPYRFDSLEQMESCIHRAIYEGKPVILFIQVDCDGYRPSSDPEHSRQWYEHAVVVLGYNYPLATLTIHDGSEIKTWGIRAFYDSSCTVLKKRARETFIKLLKLPPEPDFQNKEAFFDKMDTEPMDWTTTDPCIELAETVSCEDYGSDQPCRYHEIDGCLEHGLLEWEKLKELESCGRLVIRQSDQEPGANFHKLLFVVDRLKSDNNGDMNPMQPLKNSFPAEMSGNL
ncbi:BtrH N-terminal domain-containing protein [Endozoicomonas gorgoniicola]|uniref:BtrH N-terminal domain-containing protein n=1 Tax=Endozoicomonas gorgoniicola TaxID=1234144 RepID=A0ABT3MUK8_9GAMM|nr:BtrH N-terminal domain-containing protein [Endozoicomonas gorgoniicola]MCW7553071.1 BtrH N-terminal domain-containing protein [Endozoicomonas gorgoniicola]